MGFKLFSSPVAISIGIVGLQTPLLLLLPVAAVGQSTQTCAQATSEAQNRLTTDRDLMVELRINNLSRIYPDYPENRPTEHILGLM
jgi:hypothetical protein